MLCLVVCCTDGKTLLYRFYGVFDGHGGSQASTYAKKHLRRIIVSQRDFWSEDDELVKKAIRDGFIAFHHAMWKELGELEI